MESSKKVAPCSKCNIEMIALCRSVFGNDHPPCAELVEKKFTSTNKQMVAALWRALSDSDVKKAGNCRGVWLPLTKARLNAAYTKVFG